MRKLSTAEVLNSAIDVALGPRGIYRSKVKVEGCVAYYALNRFGKVVGRGVRVVWPGESEADVVDQLREELRMVDPIRPTYLKLVEGELPAGTPGRLTLIEALDLDGPAFARWLYA